MANRMEEVAKMLGVELEEDFRIKGIVSDLLFRITEGGVFSHYPGSEYGQSNKLMLTQLLTGESEIIRLPWKPKNGEIYYWPHPDIDCLCDYSIWYDDVTDYHRFKNNMVFKTKEEAVEVSKKMLAVLKENRND